MVRRDTFISIFGLLAVGTALPTTKSASTLQLREWKDCPSGTSYFKCFDKDGCFASDPCINPPSTTTATSAPTPSSASGSTTPDQRIMYDVIPASPDTKSQATTDFHVRSGQKDPNDKDIDQVGVFTGIPATASQCWLNWKQGAPNERTFTVQGNGRVSAIQLDNLNTSNGVSWSDVEKVHTIGTEAGPDFSFWNDPEFGATTHGTWPLTCAQTIYMKFETHKGAENSGVNDPRDVFLKQDDKNGWYITYQ